MFRASRGRVAVCSIALAALLIGSLPTQARAQMDAGSLRVLVLDQSAGVVPGVNVTLTNANTGAAQTAVSDSEGYVNFTPLPRGTYDLLAAIQGFRSHELK